MKLDLAKFVSPTNHAVHSAVSDRVLDLIRPEYDFRGRFSRLEGDSGIAGHSWRNFYYGKQRVNEAMLSFALKRFPERLAWILYGDTHGSGSRATEHPSLLKNLDRELCSERVLELIRLEYQDRGKFTNLENESEISSAQWQNFFYGKQLVNNAMLAFVISKFPDRKGWILGGARSFETRPTNTDNNTLTGRFFWLVKEWAGPKGKDIFSFLSKRSQKFGWMITEEEWAACLFDRAEPTLVMVQVLLCEYPQYAQWLMLGRVEDKQINPSNISG